MLRKNKIDVREPFVKKLVNLNPNIIFDIYGYKNQQPIWSHDFYEAIYKSKMALNLSRINNVKYYSSNRIASLIGNGILTFVDINTKLSDFFNGDEVVFYKDINDLTKQINFYKENNSKRSRIAKNGKKKYFKLFNNQIIADYISSRLFDFKPKILTLDELKYSLSIIIPTFNNIEYFQLCIKSIRQNFKYKI